jgi:hypothetical protein
MDSDSLYRIRATRACPPGHAYDDGERRQVYSAALAQFDELISAASAVGPASRPLPLFYALSQAGRAIAATHAPGVWRLQRHGLGAPKLGTALLDVEVKRSPWAKDSEDAAGGWVDSVTGVAAATCSEIFSGDVTIREFWCSLPEVSSLLPVDHEPRPKPLALVGEETHDPNLPSVMRMRLDPAHVYAVVVGFQGSGEELEAYLGKHYPTAAGAHLYGHPGFDRTPGQHTRYGSGFLFRWQADSPDAGGQAGTLNRIAPASVPVPPESAFERDDVSFSGFAPRWLRPGVRGVALSPLLTWWALLFGLSMIARYEPASWVAALDYDSSELAAPLTRLMEIGLQRVPELVVDALVGGSVYDGT